MSPGALDPEDEARADIEWLLETAGWDVQDAGEVNLAAARDVAVRYLALKPGHGEADYLLFVDGKAAGEKAWTKTVWIYDFRTNMHFTLRTKPLRREDLDDFVKSYNPENRYKRKESDRFKAFAYDDLIKRDKANLDILWLKDESLEDAASLPPPDEIAGEIADDLETALDLFRQMTNDSRPTGG